MSPPVVGLLPPPPLLPLLGVRVFTGGASSGLWDGFGLVGEEGSDELACRLLDDDVLPSERFVDDFSLDDFFDEPPPNSRLKKPGFPSSLLDMSRDLPSTSGHVISSDASSTDRSSF